MRGFRSGLHRPGCRRDRWRFYSRDARRQAEQVRLIGIDCPEKKQPFGTRAKQFTSEQVLGKEVTVKESGRDRYDRTLAEVILPDGRSLNQELVKAGLAWRFRKYLKDLSLMDLEDEARLAKRGLWAGSGVGTSRGRHP